MSYREACEALRIEPNRHNRHVIANSAARKEWAPDPERLPSAGWMERAAAFVRECAAGVESGDGLKSLYARGLTVETAHTLGIGWNPADRYGRRADWGLDEEVNPETGRFRKVWLPRGLVLQIRRKAGVTALLIRRADWKPKDDLPKYWQVKGSGNGCYVIGKPGLPVVLVESLLDAVLVWQDTIRRIEAERDEAIRTKAEIGSRREATAMATASAAVRKAAALENELGRGRDYKSVKGIPWFLDVFADTPAAYSVAGRKLSDMSRRMDYEIREIEDSRFGSVKAYHVDVIEAFRLALKNDLNMLGKYRLRRAA